MKKYLFSQGERTRPSLLSSISILMTLLLFSGCSNNLEDLITDNANPVVSEQALSYNISKQEAISIAGKVLKKDLTRGLSNIPTFEYVVNEHPTRSHSLSDTLAYVLNYPDNAGFVIVATDRRIYPVLGFSNEGNFSFDNDNAKENFIDKIWAYMEENISGSDSTYNVSENDLDGCYAVHPMVQISLGQRDPWDKYLIQEHPGSPVGCVAVATALVMSHSKSEMNFHNSVVYLKSIITAIKNGPSSTNTPEEFEGGTVHPFSPPTYTYEQAVDSMAKLLYLICEDVNMDYSTNVSLAYSHDAYNLCKSLNFSIPSGYASFDIKKVTQYLKDNHIVYVSGSRTDEPGGHAWVSDACHYCVDIDDPTQILDTYIHCDWGWGGSCNGYFSGSVFETTYGDYKPNIYFAIKREWL